jgi:hypothetical protein
MAAKRHGGGHLPCFRLLPRRRFFIIRGLPESQGQSMLQTRSALLALSLGALSAHALADELVATRPGVMCVSADALARLTLPSGDSRTHAAAVAPETQSLVEIKPGIRVTVQKAFKNTSVVTYRAAGAQNEQTFVIPNIDFAAATGGVTPVAAQAAPAPASATNAATAAPASAAAAATAAPASAVAQGYRVAQRVPTADRAGTVLEILEDARVTPELHKTLWGGGGRGACHPQAGLPARQPRSRAAAWLAVPGLVPDHRRHRADGFV